MRQRVVAGERAPPGERLEERRGERELVALVGELGERERLGRAVRGRAEHAARGGERRVGEARDAEVGELRAVGREHHVLGLHVAMDHAGAVRDGERVAELARHARHDRRIERPLADAIAQRGPVHVLEDEEQPSALLFAHVVQRDEVRMLDGRGGARLLAHAREERLARLGRKAEVVAQHLHRDPAPEHRVAREEHAPHPALAEQAHDVVASDARREIHRRRP